MATRRRNNEFRNKQNRAQRHDNYTEQLVTDCNGDDGLCEVEERTSGVTGTVVP